MKWAIRRHIHLAWVRQIHTDSIAVFDEPKSMIFHLLGIHVSNQKAFLEHKDASRL